MNRFGAWLRGPTPKTSMNNSPAASQAELVAAEIAQVEDAMTSISKIMNDDMDGAEEDLKKGDSVFHSMGLGVTTFMKSVLGFEKEIMTEASNRLADCETLSWNEMKRAQKESSSARNGTQIYPPGCEYALVHAEAQLMGAVVAMLHESLTEGIRGFYKLRKAYMTLDGIMESEAAFLREKGLTNGTTESLPPVEKLLPTTTTNGSGTPDDGDMEFVEPPEDLGHQVTTEYEGHLGKSNGAEEKMAALAINGEATKEKTETGSVHAPDTDLFTHPIDAFVHSGANMCFGILLLMISMVPPAFSKLLSIVGFRGDREKGIKMLWQSTRFNNINGALAGLVLLAYYNGALGFADILPSDEDVENGAVVGHPRKRCAELLANFRTRFPESRLWRVEEARALAGDKELHAALKILTTNTDSKMRQVNALNNFEMSLNTMYIQDYPAMRDNFLRCAELNDWSHSLYYFIAGCAELELYRNAYHEKDQDKTKVEAHKKKADELLRKAPTVAGKKRFMSRPLPFEEFVTRKVSKWEQRSKDLNIDFVDAVGVSPTQEMVYLWNGIKKMQNAELEKSVESLQWDRLTAPEAAQAKIMAEQDEIGIMDVILSAVCRAMGRIEEAKKLLAGVMDVDKIAFKGPLKDDYPQPAAHYEMAVLAWAEVQNPPALNGSSKGGDPEKDASEINDEWCRKKATECESWLNKVSNWEAYVLDARFGMRVQTGNNTLQWYKRHKGWESE